MAVQFHYEGALGRWGFVRGHEQIVIDRLETTALLISFNNQPAQVISAAVASLREALAPYVDGVSVRLRGAMWLISSARA